MNAVKTLVLTCLLAAMATGCAAHGKNGKCKSTTQPCKGDKPCTTQPSSTASAPTPAISVNRLAGEWTLAVPRHGTKTAKITFTDDTHITLDAGKSLSGEYVVQGSYLLILTNDEALRPLAWRINSADSLTVVRSPDTGDFTGATLIRAAKASTESDADDEANAGGDVISH
jgi:hypothetical protein